MKKIEIKPGSDFNNDILFKKETSIIIPGWKTPLNIEYGISPNKEFLFKIKDIDFVFRVYLNIFYEDLKEINYNIDEYIKNFLTMFRNDYIQWYENGFKEEWQRKYYNLFKNYIYII